MTVSSRSIGKGFGRKNVAAGKDVEHILVQNKCGKGSGICFGIKNKDQKRSA